MEENGNGDLRSLTAEERVKRLTVSSNSFQIDSSTPAIRYYLLISRYNIILLPSLISVFHRYYRSGEQMTRKADMLVKEHQLEDAFVLYMKYMT